MFRTKVESCSLDDIMDQNIQNIIDVRETYEFKQGHIPQAKNLPLSIVKEYQGEEPVYVICQSGMRSKKATKLLLKQGIKAINVEGGMNHWRGIIEKGE